MNSDSLLDFPVLSNWNETHRAHFNFLVFDGTRKPSQVHDEMAVRRQPCL